VLSRFCMMSGGGCGADPSSWPPTGVGGPAPATMRPSFGDVNERVRTTRVATGLVSIVWTKVPLGPKHPVLNAVAPARVHTNTHSGTTIIEKVVQGWQRAVSASRISD